MNGARASGVLCDCPRRLSCYCRYPFWAPPKQGKALRHLAKALQARYQSVRDFTADFVQTYRGGVLRTETRERGTVAVKKPGRMRWTYTSPERRRVRVGRPENVCLHPGGQAGDGRRMSRPTVSPDAGALSWPERRPGQGLYGGKGREPRQGAIALKLTPPERAEYEYLIVALDPATLQIRAADDQGPPGWQSTLRFENLKENKGISDKDFAFRIPRGVDVITNGQRN